MPYREGKGWRGTVMVNGQRKTKFYLSKGEAREWEVQTKKEMKQRTGTVFLLESYGEYLDECQVRFTKKTYDEKRFLGRRILQAWDDREISTIDPEMVRRLLYDRARSTSGHAANKDRRNLNAYFRWLRVKGILYNPVQFVSRFPHERKPQVIPTQEEVARLQAVADAQDKVMIIAYLSVAARKTEIFRWKWDEDVNFEKGMVRLGTRKTRTREMRYDWMPMNETLRAGLWSHYQRRSKDNPYVFVNRKKSYERYFYRDKWFSTLCRKARIRHIKIHSLRRYVASLLADVHKQSSKRIQRMLRHQHLSTTDIYIGEINRDLEETVKLLNGKPVGEKDEQNSL